MSDSNLHVVTHEKDGWAIKREGSSKPVSTHSTQKEAISAALDVAQDDETNVVIHRKDGRIREVKSYDGNGTEDAAATAKPQAVSALSPLGSRVRWGAVLSGFFITLATSLTLTSLGLALSLCLSTVLGAETMRIVVGVWIILTLLASLFVGGLVISRLTVGESEILEPTVYGALLWALVIFILPFLPMTASNMGFGSLTASQESSNANLSQEELVEAGLTDDQATTVAQMANPEGSVTNWMSGSAIEVAWLSFAAILLSLGAAIGGSIVGASLSEEHLVVPRRQRATAT